MNIFFILPLVCSVAFWTRPSTVQHDLIEVNRVIPSITLDIRYATADNFTKHVVYPSAKCYLRQKTTLKLQRVQEELQTIGLGLKIFDGYRPKSIQKIFWSLVPDERYVADPQKGSKHNRGAAVDVTLIDLATQQELLMPSAFDDFSKKAHRDYAAMNALEARNCKLLELIMVKHGFEPLPTEWWHFDDEDWQSYDLLDISFETLLRSAAKHMPQDTSIL